MTDGNDSAFSSANPEMDGRDGLTKREYFAAMAMQGFLSNSSFELASLSGYASDAIKAADALIEALNKESK